MTTRTVDQPQALNDLMFCNYFHDIVDWLCNEAQIGANQGQAQVESDTMHDMDVPTEVETKSIPGVVATGLSVITKADTFEDIADAALFVHEMVRHNESYDTTECEQIEKALSLLKTKANELGLDEADLLVAVDSTDEKSETCSATSEQA